MLAAFGANSIRRGFQKYKRTKTKGGLSIRKNKKIEKALAGSLLFLACCLVGTAPALGLAVYAGGQSIGLLLDAEGVTVVGLAPLTGADGSSISPAEEAGLQVGDLILSVNGSPVRGNGEILQQLKAAGEEGQACEIVYRRGDREQSVTVEPVYCRDTDSWRIGLYVRDDAAGVGTLTFWEPGSGTFGALGHSVTAGSDRETAEGLVVRAVIEGIEPGQPGCPGEKLGILQEDGWQGVICDDRDCGVFGRLESLPQAGGELIETAAVEEVTEGPARMLTVISGEEVESFDVEISRTAGEAGAEGGMVVRVTDQRLLEAAGGIVQGMSGSPLIQNDKLIGAVTHVFINDPTRGYAVFIEKMLNAAGLEPAEAAA